ncbi:MAG TPA: hypothetical protein VF526_03905 [Solirubrobacteraceae bacterium]
MSGRAEGEVVVRERFRHRLTMAGDPIAYVAIVAHKPRGGVYR